jgi:hypothetical protein
MDDDTKRLAEPDALRELATTFDTIGNKPLPTVGKSLMERMLYEAERVHQGTCRHLARVLRACAERSSESLIDRMRREVDERGIQWDARMTIEELLLALQTKGKR